MSMQNYLRVDEIRDTSNRSCVVSGYNNIVDTDYVASTNRTKYTAQNGGSGTRLVDLILQVKPKKTTNIIMCHWSLMHEFHHNMVFTIQKRVNKGSWGLVTSPSNERGYNSDSGNNKWSGYAISPYDRNDDSTAQMTMFTYPFVAATTNLVEIAVAIKASAGQEWGALNSTRGAWGQGGHESGQSVGWLWELDT